MYPLACKVIKNNLIYSIKGGAKNDYLSFFALFYDIF